MRGEHRSLRGWRHARGAELHGGSLPDAGGGTCDPRSCVGEEGCMIGDSHVGAGGTGGEEVRCGLAARERKRSGADWQRERGRGRVRTGGTRWGDHLVMDSVA